MISTIKYPYGEEINSSADTNWGGKFRFAICSVHLAESEFGNPIFGNQIFSNQILGNPIFGNPIFGSQILGNPSIR